MQFNTPILFIVFNRPETTQKVFDAIRNIKPKKLFIAADGPRANRPEDIAKCRQTREIISQIDWDCEVYKKFSDTNLGCKIGVSSAINWFFENVEEGVILEDDCLPHPSFFGYCQELLDKYKNKEEIMHINGLNLQFGEKFGQDDYYFSHLPHVWGWATWRRAWKKYDIEMGDLNNFIASNKAYELFRDKKIVNFLNSLFQHIKRKNVDTWDIQWVYSIMKAAGLVITPNTNLIENIGFGDSSTHTNEKKSKLQQKAYPLYKIDHPLKIIVSQEADLRLFKKVYLISTYNKIRLKIKKMLKI